MKFRRAEYFRYKKLGKGWKKPRGRHHKMRTYLGGKMASPAIGYGKKKELRGMHPSGYMEVLVNNLSGLKSIDAKTTAVRISGRVGKKKATAIKEEAKKLKLKVLN